MTQVSLGRVLIIDDDSHIAELLRLNLASEGYSVTTYAKAADVAAGQLVDVHLIIIDALRQQYSGIDFIRTVKASTATAQIGIIFYSKFDNERTIIDALDAGADDCIAKPFSLRELMARIRAVMRRRRRQNPAAEPTANTSFKGMTIDTDTQAAIIDGEPISLSKTEYAILSLLLKNIGVYTSRIEIFRTVWPDAAGANERIVDTNISRLRRKLGDIGANIVNRSGLGYMLTDRSNQQS